LPFVHLNLACTRLEFAGDFNGQITNGKPVLSQRLLAHCL